MKICVRCKERFGRGPKCMECGVHEDRPVRRCRRTHKAGSKRGRNSGTTNTAKNKN
jgi:hypothetical protein